MQIRNEIRTVFEPNLDLVSKIPKVFRLTKEQREKEPKNEKKNLDNHLFDLNMKPPTTNGRGK